MLKGLGDLGNIMKLQREFKNIQKRLKKTEATGETADGKVKVTVNGEYMFIDVVIDPALVSENDAKKVAKAVVFAANLAVEKIKEHSAEEMAKLTGGMNIPGLTDFMK
ncbi:MAG: YbaB/EbfC family nucleoid-associated protein [Spirochaetes bacterium]|jgi:DNA-binding YbaB/EbfC family protein|nr:YbaB/EbfC family nucleoid-associated protein [Spirochaetota bacterium]HPA71127.1 YbaB/EbfC family nucleoid-associated protein [Spirochaetota bacterium]